MLDPFTAISLATAIVQFVDFGSKLITKGYEIHANGALQENIDLTAITADLHAFTDRIVLDSSNTSAKPTSEEQALQKVAKICAEISQKLLNILTSLEVSKQGDFRSWTSLRASVRAAFRARDIDKLQNKLHHVTEQLNSHLLGMLGKNYSTTMTKLQELEAASGRMHLGHRDHLRRSSQTAHDAVKDQTMQIQRLRKATRQQQEEMAAATAAGFAAVLARLEKMRDEGKMVFTSQKILQSLEFSEIAFRHNDIKEAYNGTFEWIFDKGSTFRDWLGSGSGVFWVNGKAGSGKSTLMKYLIHHDETAAALREWAGNEEIVTASYFFWCSGLVIQKSQEGLLQSLLHQILSSCPELIPKICPRRWEADNSFDITQAQWTRQELSGTLEDALVSPGLSSKFCFFIDGLDEYSGDQFALVKEFAYLSSSDKIKFCVSSRPHNVFVKAYDLPGRRFALQDLTRPDMEKYVQGMLDQDERFRDLASRDPKAREFVATVRERAEGVFLWVYLVVKSLLRGLSDDDDIAMLQKRLEELPSDLEQFLKHILSSVDTVYREYTARAMQIATLSIPVYLVAFWHLPADMTSNQYAQELDVRPWTLEEAEQNSHQARSNINKWCRDLLEVQIPDPGGDKTNPNGVIEGSQVTFLHRTVRDFLLTSEMQDFFHGSAVCKPSPYLALCRLHLAIAKSLHINVGDDAGLKSFRPVAMRFGEYAKLCETYDQQSPIQLLRELDRVGTIFRADKQSRRTHWTNTPNASDRLRSNFLAYAVSHDLQLFVRWSLDEDLTVIRAKGVDPLICHTFQFQLILPSSERPYQGSAHVLPSYGMMSLLIERGADPHEEPKNGASIWQLWLNHCYHTGNADMWPIAELLAKRTGVSDTKIPVSITKSYAAYARGAQPREPRGDMTDWRHDREYPSPEPSRTIYATVEKCLAKWLVGDAVGDAVAIVGVLVCFDLESRSRKLMPANGVTGILTVELTA